MIKILKWTKKPSAKRLGTLLIQYHKLVLVCELVLYSKRNCEKCWIRMPEVWSNRMHRQRFATWIDDAESQKFQQDVLHMMQDQFKIGLEEAKEIHAEYIAHRKAKAIKSP